MTIVEPDVDTVRPGIRNKICLDWLGIELWCTFDFLSLLSGNIAAIWLRKPNNILKLGSLFQVPPQPLVAQQTSFVVVMDNVSAMGGCVMGALTVAGIETMRQTVVSVHTAMLGQVTPYGRWSFTANQMTLGTKEQHQAYCLHIAEDP